ncbi:MAG TPA: hypothetical protein VIR45_08515 [Kiloniellaceae bacterium]
MVLSFLRRFVPARSDRRRGPRGTQIDGHIILGGRHYSLKDWSRRGFSAVGVGADHYPGDSIALTVEVALQGETLVFDCCAVVVWVDRERKELAGVFTDLDRHLQDNILRVLGACRPEAQGFDTPLPA